MPVTTGSGGYIRLWIPCGKHPWMQSFFMIFASTAEGGEMITTEI